MSTRQQFIPQKPLTNRTENPNSTLMKPPLVPNDPETPGNFDTNRALNISGLLKPKQKTSLSFTLEEICMIDHQDTSQKSRKSLDGHQQQSSKPRLLLKERKTVIKNRENNTIAQSTSNSTQNGSSVTDGQTTLSLFSSSTTASTKPDENTTHTSAFVTRPPTVATAFNLRTRDKTVKDPTLERNQLEPDSDDTSEFTSPQSLLQHDFMDSNTTMPNPPATDLEIPNNKHSAPGTIKRTRVIDEDNGEEMRGAALNWKKHKVNLPPTQVDPGYAQHLTSEYQPAHAHVDVPLAQAQKHLYHESSLTSQDDFDGETPMTEIHASSTPQRGPQHHLKQKASRRPISHSHDLAPQAPPRAASAFDTVLDVDLDAYMKMHMEEYEAEKKKWASCEMNEWVQGADEIAAEFGALLDVVKGNMTNTLKSFASINEQLTDHHMELDGRRKVLEHVQNSLQKNGGQMI